MKRSYCLLFREVTFSQTGSIDVIRKRRKSLEGRKLFFIGSIWNGQSLTKESFDFSAHCISDRGSFWVPKGTQLSGIRVIHCKPIQNIFFNYFISIAFINPPERDTCFKTGRKQEVTSNLQR